MSESGTGGIGLYIHIPFCIQKCRYCDFLSISLNDAAYLDDYCSCLEKEIIQQAAQHRVETIATVYFGGGTPSLLSASQIERIIHTLYRSFNLQEQAEITVEANPATLSRAKLKDLRDAGVNRISLGVQSFSDHDLKLLGRAHNAADALNTVEDLQALNWNNYNIDLIYGLPGQSIDKWEKNLDRAADCDPAHISAYLLQLDPGTPLGVDLARGLWHPVGDDMEEAMFKLTREYLPGRGFVHYEISNYCRPGRECRHNLLYWSSRQYLGLGSGAVSFSDSRRWINPWPVEEYCTPLRQGRLPDHRLLETMSVQDLVAESLVLGLRLVEGVNLHEIEERLGVDPRTCYGELIDDFIGRGWLRRQGDRLCLPPDLFFVSNQILCHFLDRKQS